jgi:hypothetical protein
MALNFPDTPTTNDTFTAGDRTWIWTGIVWDLLSGSGSGNLDGGNATSNFGGITNISGGNASGV